MKTIKSWKETFDNGRSVTGRRRGGVSGPPHSLLLIAMGAGAEEGGAITARDPAYQGPVRECRRRDSPGIHASLSVGDLVFVGPTAPSRCSSVVYVKSPQKQGTEARVNGRSTELSRRTVCTCAPFQVVIG